MQIFEADELLNQEWSGLKRLSLHSGCKLRIFEIRSFILMVTDLDGRLGIFLRVNISYCSDGQFLCSW